MTLNLPRIETICKAVAIGIWFVVGLGRGIWMLLDPNPTNPCAHLLAGFLIGLAVWCAGTVLPELLALFKLNINLPTPSAPPKAPGT